MSLTPIVASALPVNGTITALGGEAEFTQLDVSRGVIYASLPSQNQIAVISTDDLQVVGTITFSGEPHGLDLRVDNNTLYVAVGISGTVAIVDLTDGNFNKVEIDVSSALSYNGGRAVTEVFDVLNVGDLVFVTGDPNSSGLSGVTVIDTANSNAMARVGLSSGGSYIIARQQPHLALSTSGDELYIDEGNSLLNRVDITDLSYPLLFSAFDNSLGDEVIIEDSRGRLTLANGSVVAATNFEFFERYTGSEFVASNDGEYLIGNGFAFQDLAAYRQGDIELSLEVTNACTETSSRFGSKIVEPNGVGIFLFNDVGDVCYYMEDEDSDLRFDLIDNCPGLNNPVQLNSDDDRLGNACDDDDDNDGLKDGEDPFPILADGDMDGVVDLRDAYPTFSGAAFDSDGDGDPDSFFAGCDPACQAASGLREDLDDDNDLIPDVSDSQPLIADQTGKPFSLLTPTYLNLSGEPEDIVVDRARSLAYVSVPSERRIYWVSLKDLSKVFSREVDGAPGIMELSSDGSDLIIALSDSGKVEFLDLNSPTLDSVVVDISSELVDRPNRRNFEIADILEVSGNRVFVIGAEFASTLVEFDRSTRSVTAVSTYTHSNPTQMVADEAAQILYIEDGPAISRYDLSLPGIPLILRALRSTSNAVKRGMSLSPDGTHLFLGEGSVVRSDLSINGLSSFTETIEYDRFESDSVIAASPNPAEQSLIDTAANVLFSFDTTTFTKTGELNNPCGGLSTLHTPLFKHAQGTRGWLLSKNNGGTFQLCFQPRVNGYSNGFIGRAGSVDKADYFLLNDTTQRFYQGVSSSTLPYTQTFKSTLSSIGGTTVHELLDSRGGSEFYSSSGAGVFLHRTTEPAGQIDFNTPVPVLPAQIKQGYSGFSSGTLTFRETGEPPATFSYSAAILIDNYQNVILSDGVNVPAYRIKRTTTLEPRTTSEAIVEEFFWFAEGFGVVQIQTDAGTVTDLAYSGIDTDRDGELDFFDSDDDNDGVPDPQDAFPLDPNESSDFDLDGIGDRRDTDDDNDGMPDVYELSYGFNPRNAADARQDADGDGRNNVTEYRQGSNPRVPDEANFIIITPILQLLLE
jgi:hypothetical protein